MSGKFEVNFESLFERLVDYTVIDDIKEITFFNKTPRNMYYHSLGGITKGANFDWILSFDYECFQIIILFLVSVQYISSSFKNKINLQSRLTAGTSYTYLLHT